MEYSDRASLEELDFPNGPLEADSPLYVLRSPLEETACQKLLEPGSLLQVQGRRYMGKCSFLNHVTGYGKNQGYWSVTVNFQDAPSTVLNDLGSFLRWFSLTVGHQLRLKNRLESYGLSESFDGQTCSEYFETYLLPASSFPIILVLKELDYLFTHPAIAPAFFELLHSWHQKAQNNDTWSNLRLVFVHATSAVPLLYSSAPQFQTDAPLVLSEFSLAQTQQLASRYGLEWAFDDVKAQRLVSLLNMVGGSPYRLAIAFYGLRVGELSLSEIMQIADEPNTIYGPHLQRLERRLAQKPYLKTVFTKVMRANDWVEIDTADAYQLEKLGLAVFNGTAVRTSCMLYQRYFETRLSEPKDPASVRRHSLEAEHITLQDLARTPDAALERSSKDHPLPSDTLCDLAELPIVEPSLPTAQDENLPPKPLLGGRYYLQAQLGSGGFGETFLA
ncbi:MAG TPA: AAA-like domain-containing protein, partial [Stenomitos sp.]